ncbi:MAG: 5-methylcytosine-specific restriction endonuclease McrA [Pirellulaceae bacterium]|jgi:5-methylcytosine-specific restriction endonuclease McrA
MSDSMLRRPTLVLNRNWQPVHVATVARALLMIYRGAARVVDPADYQTYDWDDWSQFEPALDEPSIRGVSWKVKVPEVVTLTVYDRTPKSHVSFSRRNIFKRDRYTCQYCGIQPGSDDLTLDHVLPRSHGGQSTWENCVLACLACNKRKADRIPETAGMRLRKEPVQPVWKPMYARYSAPIDSWGKFVSESYWNTALEAS